MKISTTQQRFIEAHGDNNYSTLMGPNWHTILNFWLYLDTLSTSQIETVSRGLSQLHQDDTFTSHRQTIVDFSSLLVPVPSRVWRVAADEARKTGNRGYMDAVEWATDEMICYHKIIEHGKKLIYIPLFGDL